MRSTLRALWTGFQTCALPICPCRLVIDTGIHHMVWTRDQALAYLRERTALSEHEVTTEVDRYISWPAQALSYKLGELKILQLREEAEQALGTRFDVRK